MAKLVSIPSKSGHYSRHVHHVANMKLLELFQSPLSRGTTPDVLQLSSYLVFVWFQSPLSRALLQTAINAGREILSLRFQSPLSRGTTPDRPVNKYC